MGRPPAPYPIEAMDNKLNAANDTATTTRGHTRVMTMTSAKTTATRPYVPIMSP